MPVELASLFLHLARVADRIPDRPLARRIRLYRVAFAIWTVLWLLFSLAMALWRAVRASALTAAPASVDRKTLIQVLVVLVLPNLIAYGLLAWLLRRFQKALAGVLDTVVARRADHIRRRGVLLSLPDSPG